MCTTVSAGSRTSRRVGKPQFNDAKTVAIVFVTPNSAPQDEATAKLVHRLRNDVVPKATEGGDAAVYVSGLNAAFIDIASRIQQRLPIFLLYIIGVTFIVLAMAFRSIVVSLTAAITTILSAFIGFGVLTLVIQEGHLLGLTGLDRTGPIETFVPPIAFAILFGLSMDYMVFLTSRIREEHVHGLNTRDAVEHGIAAIGRVIVAAAIIMATVFSAFIVTPDRISKEFGLLLAVAILTDALVVKMTLIPAFFTLMGEKTWYIPRWLDRILPNITIEPPHDGEEPPPGRHAGAERGHDASAMTFAVVGGLNPDTDDRERTPHDSRLANPLAGTPDRLPGRSDDRPRRHDRRRRAAVDPRGPRVLGDVVGMGRECVSAHLRRVPAARRTARRPLRAPAPLHRRDRALHGRVARVRARRLAGCA